jgi:hypothetical protein
MADRTPEQIRASIEQNRHELGTSVAKLRTEIARATDWRSQLRRNEPTVLIGAAAVGFVLGGGIAGIGGILFGRRRRG